MLETSERDQLRRGSWGWGGRNTAKRGRAASGEINQAGTMEAEPLDSLPAEPQGSPLNPWTLKPSLCVGCAATDPVLPIGDGALERCAELDRDSDLPGSMG